MGLHRPAVQAAAALLLLGVCAHLATTQSGRQAVGALLGRSAPWPLKLADAAGVQQAALTWPAQLWPGWDGAAAGPKPVEPAMSVAEPALPSAGPSPADITTAPSSRSAAGAGAVWPLGSPAAAGTDGAQQQAAAPPLDFNWKLYKFYSGGSLSAASQQQAVEHYLRSGQPNRGCYHSPPLITIRYLAEAGLTNQLLGHLSALGIAEGIASRGLPVQLVLQPALWRSSFNHSFYSTAWTPAPIRTLLDVDSMAAYWEPRGVTILEQVGNRSF
jgi:hypothetical protein